MSGPRVTIQSLWIGPRLSTMERLSIASFLHHDHDYHLFTYSPVEGVPPGAVVRDAREILPESRIFQYREHASYAGFANFFRYKLLLERGGWWVDTDVVCLRPFDFDEPYVIATEHHPYGGEVPTNSFLKAPEGSPAFAEAWERCQSSRPETLTWGEMGPLLIGEIASRFDLGKYLQPAKTFCPVPYQEWARFTEPGVPWSFDASTRAVHLWNELWRRGSKDKDFVYPPESAYEQWKRKYLA
jgi:Glycosyltransferase sugar-binding region containing DXD motif/Alpha 1,4-glycosyltransferase conserved region